ncbi:MAG: MFS transporter [Chloroflexi bacterium]|nr:MFS transporter [Chloroflexota bacterium]
MADPNGPLLRESSSSRLGGHGGLSTSTMAPALRSRNFRLFWIGQTISLIGTSLQVVAEGWLIYQLTHSTFWLGMTSFLALLPVLPISLVGGILIDRMPRRKLIQITQCCLLVQSVIFGLLAVSGQLALWHIIVLYFIFGAILAIDHPARRAFLVELVHQDDLANAVALNAAVFNLSGLIGYALGGLLIATAGAGYTMLLNAFTYIAPIIMLALIRVPDVAADRVAKRDIAQAGDRPISPTPQPFKAAVVEGMLTLWRQPALLGAVSLMAVVGGLTGPALGMLPAYADAVVHTNAIGLGILMAAGALGSILGTIVIARFAKRARGPLLTVISLCLPILLFGFAFASNLVLACVLLVALGAALLILQSLVITMVQLQIPDRVRGRVMTLYSILHAGSETGGNMVVGWLALYLGLPFALCAGGLAAALYALGLRTALPAVDRLE